VAISQPVLIAGIFIALVVAGYFLLANAPGKYDSFAQCLSDKGVKMYGAFWCPHCKDQKEMFGSSWKYVDYVECSTPDGSAQLQVCTDAGIKGYPTWDIGGTKKDGVLTLGELSQETGCPLNVS
jgi:hypothetical protein